MTNEYRYFLESDFAGVSRLFLLIQMQIMQKGIKLEGIIYQKVLLKIIMSSSMERTVMAKQLILILKKYKEIRKLTTGHSEVYATGCLSD